MLSYGALCRGLLSGKMTLERTFTGDDLRKADPKFQGSRFRQYLAAVQRLEALARERFGKSVLALAVLELAEWVQPDRVCGDTDPARRGMRLWTGTTPESGGVGGADMRVDLVDRGA
jgi:hypothetical protein